MKRILIVEDNDANLYLLRFILEKNGFEVLEARTGEEGVKQAIENIPDLILMDIQLPGIDGHEATRRIRMQEALKSIPIIALTSYAMVGDREISLKAGCSAHIEKPINPDTFIGQIRKFFAENEGVR